MAFPVPERIRTGSLQAGRPGFLGRLSSSPLPPPPRRRGRPDEAGDQVMGRALARAAFWLRLVHPGPSVLATGCFVAATAAALHRLPPATGLVRLVFLMLPLQFAIGAVNDVCDREVDRLEQPDKPLVAGHVPRAAALTVAGVCIVTGLATAATFPWPTLAVAVLGLSAGLVYDLGLKRTPASWMPWWVGFVALPICARAAAGRLDAVILAAVPLALGLALALHLANALPDVAGDRRSRSRGLAVQLGAARALQLSLAGILLTAGAAILAAPWLGQPWGIVAAGAIPALGASTALAARPQRRPFILLAPAVAILAATWLLTLP